MKYSCTIVAILIASPLDEILVIALFGFLAKRFGWVPKQRLLAYLAK